MGFEFRDNTSDICLQKGISGMTGFKDGSIGFEWRWTYNSDLVDDFYDGNLDVLMDGGYADEDINLYTEEKYLESRWENEIQKLEPYNMFYVMKDGIKCQLIEKDADGKDIPINYSSWMPENRELDPFTMEYGVRVSNVADENGNYTFSNIVMTEGEQNFNITLEGIQNLEQGVYLYTSEVRGTTPRQRKLPGSESLPGQHPEPPC